MKHRNFLILAVTATVTLFLFQNCAGGGADGLDPANNSNSDSDNASLNTNVPPTVNAGTDVTVTAPAYNIPLTATAADEDGTIASVQWLQMSGPSQAVLTGESTVNLNVTDLKEGTYVFRAVATDDKGDSAFDEVSIIANKAGNVLPVVDAGLAQTIQMPLDKVTLTGTATDSDGTIASYQWTQVSGPSTATFATADKASTLASGLVVGSYVFQLQAKDNADASALATVTITVVASPTVNVLPTANAGLDQVILLPVSQVTVKGTGTDTDGTVASTVWSQVSGPNQAKIETSAKLSSKITGLVKGIYVFKLTVTDDLGGKKDDSVQVFVNAAGSKPAAINAGADQIIQLPKSEASLTGTTSSATNTISKIQWIQESGPKAATMATPTKFANKITALVAGTYQFQLKVTNKDGAISIARVKITVKAASTTTNKAPVVNAGAKQTLQMPNNLTTLAGTASDSDGTIAKIQWSQISGPNSATFDNPQVLAPKISSLLVGVYKLQLKVTDNDGASSTATVDIELKAAPVVIDTTAPKVKMTVAANSVLSGKALITAEASDNIGVHFVEFYIDGVLLSGKDKTAPYSMEIDTASMVNGVHKLKAAAGDVAGNRTVSAEISVEFLNPREGRWSAKDSASSYISISSDKLSVRKDDGSASASAAAYANFSLNSGKWYFEATVTDVISGNRQRIGIASTIGRVPLNGVTGEPSYGYDFNGTISSHQDGAYGNVAGGVALTAGKTLGVAVDQTGGTISFYVNGVFQKKVKIQKNFSFSPMFMGSGNSNGRIQANFGSKAFKYTPPSGFKPAWKY